MSKKLIPAVAYLRKSTAGTDARGKTRQEKSIGQQRQEIESLAKLHGYQIIREYKDEGVSGWKRGDDRPDFDRMTRDAKTKRDFHAILCDDLDRFSRADVMAVFADLHALSLGGVVTLHAVNQGEHELGGDGNIGSIIQLMIDFWGSNDFSRKLSRRIALSRRNAAQTGKRSGGYAPFGYANDGQGSLKLGDAEQVAIVREIFYRFDVGTHSLRSLASDLNERGIPSPRGLNWTGATIRHILQNPVYKGEFLYNRRKAGQFHFVDDQLEVRPATDRTIPPWKLTDDGTFRTADTHAAIVDAELFERVQKKIAAHKKRRRQIRDDGYPLSGVLRCGHCGKPLWAATRRGVRVYTCGTSSRKGNAVCRAYSIREDAILPFVIEKLKEELSLLELEALRPDPPKPFKPAGEELERIRNKLAELNRNITTCREKLALASNEIFKLLHDQAEAWIAERDQLSNQLADLERFSGNDAQVRAGVAYVQEYAAWLRSKERELVTVWSAYTKDQVSKTKIVSVGKTDITLRSDRILADVAKLKQLLHDLGLEVVLNWREAYRGKKLVFAVEKGRFRLGQSIGNLETSDGSLCEVPVGEWCNDIRGGDRCDSRRGTD